MRNRILTDMLLEDQQGQGLLTILMGCVFQEKGMQRQKYFYAKTNYLGKDFWEHGMKEIEIFRDVDGENRIL